MFPIILPYSYPSVPPRAVITIVMMMSIAASVAISSSPFAMRHSLPGIRLANISAGSLDVLSPFGHLSVFHAHMLHPDPTAPLIVWMNGGPGASSLGGFFTELGPYLLNSNSKPKAGQSADEWTLFSNPSAWSHIGSLLVWEQPAGVGFSRCVTDCPKQWNDTSSAIANVHTLLAFYEKYPSERSRDLILAGESYAGIYVPLLAQQVLGSSSLRGVRLRAIAVGDGCIGYGVTGACGADSLNLFVTTLERVAPGVSRAALAAVRSGCTKAELTSGRQPGQLSTGCAEVIAELFKEVGEYNE